MEAVNLPQTQVIPTSFEQFKKESESKVSALFGNIFPETTVAEQTNYDLTLRSIYLLASGDEEVDFNFNGLSDQTKVQLFTQLIKALQNPSTDEISADNMDHISEFTEESELTLSKVSDVFGQLNNNEMKSVYLAMAKVEILVKENPPNPSDLDTMMKSCHINRRREQLKFINSVIKYFVYHAELEFCFQEIVDAFELNSSELTELAKHLIKNKPHSVFRTQMIPRIKDEKVRFQLAQFFARNSPLVMDHEDIFQLDLSEPHKFELLKILNGEIGDVETLKRVSTLLLKDPNYFDRERLNNFIDEAFAKNPLCLCVWDDENFQLLPPHIFIGLAKRGYTIALVISLSGKEPQEFYDLKFISEALIASSDYKGIPDNLEMDAQIIAIRKILEAAKSAPDTLNRQEVLQITRAIPQLYRRLPETLRKDPAFVMIALPLAEQGDIDLWQALPLEIKNRQKHALRAIQNNIYIFYKLSGELRSDQDILDVIKSKALEEDLQALRIIRDTNSLPKLLMDRDLAKALIKYDVNIYSKLPDPLKRDREFIQIVLERVMEGDYDKWLLLPQEEQLKDENIRQVLKKYPEFYTSSAMPISKLDEKGVLRTLFYASPHVVDEYIGQPGFEWVDTAVQFATTVLETDGYIKVKDEGEVTNSQKRAFDILKKLPIEIQMIYANRAFGSAADIVLSQDVEWALRYVFFKISQQTK